MTANRPQKRRLTAPLFLLEYETVHVWLSFAAGKSMGWRMPRLRRVCPCQRCACASSCHGGAVFSSCADHIFHRERPGSSQSGEASHAKDSIRLTPPFRAGSASAQDPRRTIARVRRIASTALIAAAAGAHAASFDCQAAKTPAEKAICGSPKLSALDEKLAAEYERALHALSPAGAAQLKASQRSWLRFATQVCVPGKRPGHGESAAECLEVEFGRRLDQLAQAGLRIGPYVFNRIDYFAAARTHEDDTGAHSGFVTNHVAFVQIDAPLTPATIAWNAAQRKADPGPISAGDAADDAAEDDDTDVAIGCVGDRFVSLQVDESEYNHNTPHGSFGHEVRDMLLAPTLRKMTAGDLFAAGAPWKMRLPTLFWNVYAQDPDADKDTPSVAEAIKSSAANPERWLLTPAGLQISFDAGEAGCYACNPGAITVPWAALKPMLASPEFAACKAPPPARP